MTSQTEPVIQPSCVQHLSLLFFFSFFLSYSNVGVFTSKLQHFSTLLKSARKKRERETPTGGKVVFALRLRQVRAHVFSDVSELI